MLFLASEALAAEAYNQLPSLLEYAAERGIMLATPSSLIATLKTAAFTWKQVALAESANEVFNLGRELYDRLGTLGGHFDKVGRMLGASVTAYNQAVGSIEGRVFPTARKLRELHVSGKELATVNAVEAAVRPLTASELVDDAAQVTPMIGARANDPEGLNRPQPALDELIAGEIVDQAGEGTVDELDLGAEFLAEFERHVDVDSGKLPCFRVAIRDPVVVGPDADPHHLIGLDSFEPAACGRGRSGLMSHGQAEQQRHQ